MSILCVFLLFFLEKKSIRVTKPEKIDFIFELI